MAGDLPVLLATAAAIGVGHTLLGPDHYVPFVAMGRARGWSAARTAAVTALCGLGHVLSSVVLGLAGIALGVAVGRLEGFESARGGVAGWSLAAFGLVYAAWGVRAAVRRRPHVHVHAHGDGVVHAHEHVHEEDHLHVHDAVAPAAARSITPWVLFTVFLLGPCEPLIPLLMYPAATSGPAAAAFVAAVFGAATIGTMLSVVLAARAGLSLVRTEPFERWSHALAGAAVLACGVAVIVGL